MSLSGAEPGTDWRHARTERLWLDLPVEADVEALYAIHGDPGTWRHFPSGRHTSATQAVAMVGQSERRFTDDGLAYWSVRDRADGRVIGRGGCSLGDGLPWWNLYYRFTTSAQGRGYAAELGRAAIDAAREVRPQRPVIAFLLEHNAASRRTAEKLAMSLVWRGPDLGNPDPDAVRLVFCDRDPDAGLLATIEEKFRPV